MPREGHAATLVDDVIYLFGGRGVDGKDLGDLAAFKITNQRWYMFQNMGPCPTGRSGHALSAVKERIFVLGGESFSSNKGDDPSIMYILDTSKIKYPGDVPGSKPPQNPPPRQIMRKVSSSQMGDSHLNGPPQSRQIIQNHDAKAAVRAQSPMNAGDDEAYYRRQRAASPMSQAYQAGSNINQVATARSMLPQERQQSFNQQSNSVNGYANNGPPNNTVRNTISDVRNTTSPDYDADLTYARQDGRRAPLSQNGVLATDPRHEAARSISPESRNMGASRNGPTSVQEDRGSPPKPAEPLNNSKALNGVHQSDIRSASPQLGNNAKGYKHPADAFYYPGQRPNAATPMSGPTPRLTDEQSARDALHAKDGQLSLMKRKQLWLKAQLSLAQKHGFVPTGTFRDSIDDQHASQDDVEDEQMDVGEVGTEKYKIVQTILRLKQELRRSKMMLASNAQSASQRITDAETARGTAIQEAAYLKAKVSALQSNSQSDFARIEASRTSELERRLAEVIGERDMLRDRAEALADALSHEKRSHDSTRQHAAELNARAKSAEESHSRALDDVAGLHTRANKAEDGLREHASRMAEALSQMQRHQNDASELRLQVNALQTSQADHQRTIEHANSALTASNGRADEAEALWQQARQDIAHLEMETSRLRAELDAKQREVEIAGGRAEEMERLWLKSKEEAEAARTAMRGGMEELLTKNREMHSSGGRSGDSSLGRLTQLEDELASMRILHRKTSESANAAQTSLSEAMSRIAQLEANHARSRSEAASVKQKLALALDQHRDMKEREATKEQQLLESTRKAELLEIRARTLKDFAAEQGLLIEDDAVTGQDVGSSKSMHVQNLEKMLSEKDQRLADLEAMHASTRDELSRMQGAHADVDARARALHSEVERLQSLQVASASNVSQRSDLEEKIRVLEQEVTETNETNQQKMQQLESEYQTAVHYVKRTERMMRLMKEELTKHKTESSHLAIELERVEHEKSEMQSRLADNTTVAGSRLLNDSNDKSHNDTMTKDRDRRIEQLELEVEQMRKSLASSQHELEETLQLNETLNSELDTALRSPPGKSKSGGVVLGEDHNDTGALAERTKWADQRMRYEEEMNESRRLRTRLEEENHNLEQRLRESENKISILLDQMESTVDSYRTIEGDIMSGEHGGEPHVQKSVDRNSRVLDSLAHELDAIKSQWETSHEIPDFHAHGGTPAASEP